MEPIYLFTTSKRRPVGGAATENRVVIGRTWDETQNDWILQHCRSLCAADVDFNPLLAASCSVLSPRLSLSLSLSLSVCVCVCLGLYPVSFGRLSASTGRSQLRYLWQGRLACRRLVAINRCGCLNPSWWGDRRKRFHVRRGHYSPVYTSRYLLSTFCLGYKSSEINREMKWSEVYYFKR